ncbi:unnamed protein product [Ilex paraguariensis]|uniref:Uncharacterized protein n=1 Tax=Ilex paraguariensis TaxID=185542 RepID=A0ABC8SKH7_9AQUA
MRTVLHCRRSNQTVSDASGEATTLILKARILKRRSASDGWGSSACVRSTKSMSPNKRHHHHQAPATSRPQATSGLRLRSTASATTISNQGGIFDYDQRSATTINEPKLLSAMQPVNPTNPDCDQQLR